MERLRILHKFGIWIIVGGYVLIEAGHRLGLLSSYIIQVLVLSLINVMVTVSLNLVNGYTGQFCVGQAGFMALGAYMSATITTLLLPTHSWPTALQIPAFLVGLLAGAGVAGAVGYLIGAPTLRLKGDYLAIVTLAFGEVVRAFLRSFKYTGGARGLGGIPGYTSLFWVFISTLGAVAIARNLVFSTYGRAWMGIRDSEIAAEAMGIDTTKMKTIVFTTSATITGFAGGLYAHVLRFLHPDNFSYLKSIDYLVYLYAGGMGSLSGSIVGAISLTIVPEVLRFLRDWRLVIYPFVLIVLMLTRPEGLLGGREFAFIRPKADYLKRWAQTYIAAGGTTTNEVD